MNLETKITMYKFTPQVFTLTPDFPGWQAFFEAYSIAGLNMKNMAKSMAYCHIFVQMINRYNVQTI